MRLLVLAVVALIWFAAGLVGFEVRRNVARPVSNEVADLYELGTLPLPRPFLEGLDGDAQKPGEIATVVQLLN